MNDTIPERNEDHSYISGYDNEGNPVHFDINVELPEINERIERIINGNGPEYYIREGTSKHVVVSGWLRL